MKRTEERTVLGISMDLRPRMRQIRLGPITVRITADRIGKSMSLYDEKRMVMMQIPLEPLEDLLRQAMEMQTDPRWQANEIPTELIRQALEKQTDEQ